MTIVTKTMKSYIYMEWVSVSSSLSSSSDHVQIYDPGREEKGGVHSTGQYCKLDFTYYKIERVKSTSSIFFYF